MKKVNVKYITRTIKSASIRAIIYDTETEEISENTYSISYHGETVEELKAMLDEPGKVCLKIRDCEVSENLYRIPEDIFLAYAEKVEK